MEYCERCFELSNALFDKTEYYVSLVEQQNRMFREGKGKAVNLDTAIASAKVVRDGIVEWVNEHRASHASSPR